MNEVSRCCKAEVIVSTNLNGDIYGYMCTKCHKPCLIFSKDLVDELNEQISLDKLINKHMEKITKEQWIEHVSKNCSESYSLAVELAIMDLWEAGVKTEEEASNRLQHDAFGLSGSQAMIAIAFALNNDASDWLDKEMVKASEENEQD